MFQIPIVTINKYSGKQQLLILTKFIKLLPKL